MNSSDDKKLTECVSLVSRLLDEGFHPILWCRYIATAEYLAQGLQQALKRRHPHVRVIAITGRIGDDERRAKVDELAQERSRVLVATDCLSEGINLQDGFNAAVHYDLPWNPNRLEQREGRVNRYGQRAKVVKAVRYFSPDSAVNGVVIEVLLNKARDIHRTLGTHVPVPEESETVTAALLNALFLRGKPAQPSGPVQQVFDFGEPEIRSFHRRWELDAEREKINRTRFAQRRSSPPRSVTSWKQPTPSWAIRKPSEILFSMPPSGLVCTSPAARSTTSFMYRSAPRLCPPCLPPSAMSSLACAG